MTSLLLLPLLFAPASDDLLVDSPTELVVEPWQCESCDVRSSAPLRDWFRSDRRLCDYPYMAWTDISWRHPGDHVDPDDPQRHTGQGDPLHGTSWLNRPLYAGWFYGQLYGGELISGRVDQSDGVCGGYHVGYDFDHYWGCETRFAFSNVDLTLGGVDADTTSRDWFLDSSLLYYPWGDAYWRPYLSLGLGIADFRFYDDQNNRVVERPVTIPLGIGVKCYYDRWLALRVGLVDNISFGSGAVSSTQNLALVIGIETRFGGRPTSYYPFNPGSHVW